MCVVVPIACDELGQKKQAEVADYQHVRQTRQVIPVSWIIDFKIAQQMLFEPFYHHFPFY